MLASSTDRDITFAEPKVLSEDATVQTFPKVSAFDEHVYVSWNVDDEGPMTDGGVFFLASADNGATFSNVTNLSRDEKDFGVAQVASYADRVYVIWGGSTSNKVESLFLVSSEDNGKTFDGLNVLDQTKLSNVRSPSNVEMIANGSDQLYIA
jgi:predicted neuraminidase